MQNLDYTITFCNGYTFYKQSNKSLGNQIHTFPHNDEMKVMVMSDHLLVVMIMAI